MLTSLITAWLVADLGSGLVHWWEDRYGDPDWPWPWGDLVVKPNIEHHEDPYKITRSGYFERNATTLIPASCAAMVAFMCGYWSIAAGLMWLTQANEIHAWAHQKCCWPIRVLQTLGILQSPAVHAEHHVRPFNKNYCTCTDWLNPILQAVGFWDRLERLVILFTGIRPRPEREVA